MEVNQTGGGICRIPGETWWPLLVGCRIYEAGEFCFAEGCIQVSKQCLAHSGCSIISSRDREPWEINRCGDGDYLFGQTCGVWGTFAASTGEMSNGQLDTKVWSAEENSVLLFKDVSQLVLFVWVALPGESRWEKKGYRKRRSDQWGSRKRRQRRKVLEEDGSG